MIFGGWGLVGSAIAKQLLEEQPSEIVVTSLRKNEADEIHSILENHPLNQGTNIVSVHGDLFVREELSDMSKADIYSKAEQVELLIHDIYDDLGSDIVHNSKLFQIMDLHKPQILIDCINTATVFAYQNVYQIVAQLRDEISEIRQGKASDNTLIETVERMISTLYIPQLIRHVQLLIESMRQAETKLYLKVGTSGTGGMGFNIPYTHSEDKPSKMLMSKSSLAGAHTMLLWLLGRTPHAPIVKEIKPTAAIAWKKIGYGKVVRRGSHIPLYDALPSVDSVLGQELISNPDVTWKRLGDDYLESVYIDAGENGYFSAGEFSVLTGEGQMEFVTPEEIADLTMLEIKGGNTGNDIISSLDSSVLLPSYRAGLIRKDALEKMEVLEEETGKDSVAFELLGPPRLTKLLYEVYILKRIKGNIKAVLTADPEELAIQMEKEILENQELRSTILSVGTPILLKDGVTFLRGPDMSEPNFEGHTVLKINEENIEKWTGGGWLDLRVSNVKKWQKRLAALGADMKKETKQDYSSYYFRNRRFLGGTQRMDIGIIVNWVLEYEDMGYRIK